MPFLSIKQLPRIKFPYAQRVNPSAIFFMSVEIIKNTWISNCILSFNNFKIKVPGWKFDAIFITLNEITFLIYEMINLELQSVVQLNLINYGDEFSKCTVKNVSFNFTLPLSHFQNYIVEMDHWVHFLIKRIFCMEHSKLLQTNCLLTLNVSVMYI